MQNESNLNQLLKKQCNGRWSWWPLVGVCQYNIQGLDILDAHSYILPVDLLFNKLLFHAALRLCSLPKLHLLNPIMRMSAQHKAKQHHSPLHNLIHHMQVNPVSRSPGYSLSFNTVIPSSKNAALTFANLTNTTVPVHVYSDGSGYEGGIGTAVLLYINDHLVRSLRFYLGTSIEHTVYEAEGVELLMLWGYTSSMG
jgi:hypothetical protein